jgi:hypothetical protein
MRQALPDAYQDHVKQDTPVKKLDAIKRKLSTFLDTHMQIAGTSRKAGEEWSIVTSKTTALNKGLNEISALSVRLTTGGQVVGDYARTSSPIGEIIIHKDATVNARGTQWFCEAVRQCERGVAGVVTNTELLKIWRSLMGTLNAWSWTKLAWFVPPQSRTTYDTIRAVFDSVGAQVPTLGVTLGLGGANEAEVLDSLLKHTFGTMQEFAGRLITAHSDQANYFDASSDRKQGIRLGQIEDNRDTLKGLCDTLGKVLNVVDDATLFMGVGVADIKQAAEALFQSHEATCDIDRKRERVPGYVEETAREVLKITQSQIEDIFDGAESVASVPTSDQDLANVFDEPEPEPEPEPDTEPALSDSDIDNLFD